MTRLFICDPSGTVTVYESYTDLPIPLLLDDLKRSLGA